MSRGHSGYRAARPVSLEVSFVSFVPAFVSCPVAPRVAAAQEPTSPQPVSAAQLQDRDRQSREARLCGSRERVAHRPADTGGAGGARPAASRRRARGRLRSISRARPADRVQRSAHEGLDARSLGESQRSPARRRLQFFRAQSRSGAAAAVSRRRSTRSRGSSSGRRSCARWRRSPRRPATRARAPVRPCCARSREARISFEAPSSRRSATTRPRTRSTRFPPSRSSMDRCRTMRR